MDHITTYINACIQFNIIETFVNVLESYKHFHTIEVHERCFIISEDTVLTYFCLIDRAEPFRSKRSWLILYIIKIWVLSVKQKYVNSIFSVIMKHLYAWQKKDPCTMFWQNKFCQIVVHRKPYQNIYKSQNGGFFKKCHFWGGLRLNEFVSCNYHFLFNIWVLFYECQNFDSDGRF